MKYASLMSVHPQTVAGTSCIVWACYVKFFICILSEVHCGSVPFHPCIPFHAIREASTLLYYLGHICLGDFLNMPAYQYFPGLPFKWSQQIYYCFRIMLLIGQRGASLYGGRSRLCTASIIFGGVVFCTFLFCSIRIHRFRMEAFEWEQRLYSSLLRHPAGALRIGYNF